jgi:D-beta-D-heptose 7-phosphate kinase/D-beta-D-heptose 1-phosphate adenosyltransferase
MTGVVNRISPEAPVPIFNIEESADVLGMAANVQVNLTKLNCSVFFVTNKEDIVKTRFVDKKSGYQLLRVDHDPKVEPWDENLEEPLDIFDAVVISDYDKGFLTYQHIETLISKFKGPVFIDTKKPDLGRFRGAYVKINETENKNKISVNDKLIVTLGGGGASYNGKVFPTKSAEVTDVCGCGDTFIASLAYQYLLTKDIEKAIMFANVAAGITVQHRGNYAPSYDEIKIAGY